jgi:hypothetical protein
MGMLVISLVVGILATARITRLLVEDRLTLAYRTWVVKRFGENSMPAELVYCAWCTSMWVAMPVMLVAGLYPNRWVIAVLAVPAASMIAAMLVDKTRE